MRPAHNPFRSKAIAKQRYRMDSQELSSLLHQTKKWQYRGCIMGPHGTGKSTLLEDIGHELKKQGGSVHTFRLHADSSIKEKFQTVLKILKSPREQINCLDGGECLSMPIWQCVLCLIYLSRKSLLATTHKPSLLKPLFLTQINNATMLSLTQSLAGEYWTEALQELALEHYEKSGGNCREVFRACYWHLSQQYNSTDPHSAIHTVHAAQRTRKHRLPARS